jgi:hypothetical protein
LTATHVEGRRLSARFGRRVRDPPALDHVEGRRLSFGRITGWEECFEYEDESFDREKSRKRLSRTRNLASLLSRFPAL